MGRKYLEFEKPIEKLDKEIERLQAFKMTKKIDTSAEILKLKQQLIEVKKNIFSNLTDWQIVQVARHPDRPKTLDYIEKSFDTFIELHGDRTSGDDPAIVAGIGKFKGITVAFAGHQKGKETKENIERKFGMAHPEGYRKALRIMKIAEKFNFPVITFIDTPGAYPDKKAEEQGQAYFIAKNLLEMALLRTPILCIIIGEGGSGGALAIGLADRILMQQYSIYSVISPEGCASILWKDQKAVEQAAKALKLTAKSLLALGVIDEIIPEPIAGAHSNPEEAIKNVEEAIERNLTELKTINIEKLLEIRYQKYRKIGFFVEMKEEYE